ncbi:MAG: hypothetical protein JXR72_03530 [Proteobacteria bacterium]|nr:hypothetical protein [Pseudomonadota bacterium]
MRKTLAPCFFFLVLLSSLVLAFPPSSLALMEVGVGVGVTSFDDDLEDVNTGSGITLEATVGSGVMRLMAALQASDHDEGDYSALMFGPMWTFPVMNFTPRVYALVSGHEFEDVDGWGVTLGGGVGWSLFPAATLGLDLRVSQWEGDDVDARTGTFQVYFGLGF